MREQRRVVPSSMPRKCFVFRMTSEVSFFMRMLRAIMATLIVLSISPAPASASSLSGLPKPVMPAHADVAPVPPGTTSAQAIGSQGWTDPAETGACFYAGPLGSSVINARIAADSTTGSQIYPSRVGDGRNPIGFASFEDGDMVVVLDPRSPTGHAGLFDRRYYASLASYAVWSANTVPTNGVQREPCSKYRGYEASYGLDVPGSRAYRFQARDFAARQIRKPYSLTASKTDTRSFYCSKLAWCAWFYTARVDLDGSGGFWVWPHDLIASRYTRLFGYWN